MPAPRRSFSAENASGHADSRSYRPDGSRSASREEHCAGVRPRIHLHDGDAGFPVIGFHRSVDRRHRSAAAVKRECWGSHVGQVQNGLWQDDAVGSHDGTSGIAETSAARSTSLRSRCGWATEYHARARAADRARLQLHPASGGRSGCVRTKGAPRVRQQEWHEVPQQRIRGFRQMLRHFFWVR